MLYRGGRVPGGGPASRLWRQIGDEEAIREAIDGEGRQHPSDLGWLDEEGDLHIGGRKKDIIIRNDNNIPAGKIEEALHKLEAVSRAAVVGVYHKEWGEAPCALVVLKDDRAMSEEEMKKRCDSAWQKMKCPK